MHMDAACYESVGYMKLKTAGEVGLGAGICFWCP